MTQGHLVPGTVRQVMTSESTSEASPEEELQFSLGGWSPCHPRGLWPEPSSPHLQASALVTTLPSPQAERKVLFPKF